MDIFSLVVFDFGTPRLEFFSNGRTLLFINHDHTCTFEYSIYLRNILKKYGIKRQRSEELKNIHLQRHVKRLQNVGPMATNQLCGTDMLRLFDIPTNTWICMYTETNVSSDTQVDKMSENNYAH